MGKTIEAQAAENRRGCCAGVGLSTGSNTRFVSDSLHFTGIDLGDREGGTPRRGLLKGSEEDEEDEDSSSEDDDYEEELAKLAPKHREGALVQIALQRIERAKARGRTDVNLSKEELTALERRRKRMEEEAARKIERKKRKEQRIAVPLTHLEPISRKKKGHQSPPVSHLARQDSLPRHSSSNSNLSDAQDRQGYPPMGYFPPPTASRSRPRSGTASSQRPPSRAREDPRAAQYEYMQGRPVSRGASDSAVGARSAYMGPVEQPWVPNISPNASPSGGRQALDPFQFQVAGPRASMQPGAPAASRRHVPSPSEAAYMAQRRGAPPAATRSRQGSRRLTPDEETSEEESEEEDEEDDEEDEEEEEEEGVEESSSDDPTAGAQIREAHRRRQPEVIVVEDPEPEPEPEPEPVRKAPVTRRSVGGKRRKR
ncbi:Fc.00g113040.m01.CDS01 [Cosmosporella sp. VM-42]